MQIELEAPRGETPAAGFKTQNRKKKRGEEENSSINNPQKEMLGRQEAMLKALYQKENR